VTSGFVAQQEEAEDKDDDTDRSEHRPGPSQGAPFALWEMKVAIRGSDRQDGPDEDHYRFDFRRHEGEEGKDGQHIPVGFRIGIDVCGLGGCVSSAAVDIGQGNDGDNSSSAEEDIPASGIGPERNADLLEHILYHWR